MSGARSPNLFERLHRLYAFQLDACATAQNTQCATYFDEDTNALEQDWACYRRVWLNPPYGRLVGSFMQKAYAEAQKGALVPVRTDTRWWHRWVRDKAEVYFLKGRLRFVNESGETCNAASFPSALVVYAPDLVDYCSPDHDAPAGGVGHC